MVNCGQKPSLTPPGAVSLPRTPRPYQRRPASHHRVLVSLLYARFGCLTRHPDSSVVADQTRYAQALGLRTHRFREALAALREQGLLDLLIWHPQGWFQARPACPPALARTAGTPTEVIDV